MRNLFCFVFLISSFSKNSIFAALPRFEDFFSKSKLGKVESQESEHFRVTWVNPQDGILAPALLTYMEAAHRDLAPAFEAARFKEGKAPIEIFPDLKSFSEVSGLSLQRFRATGTIALTLEQRLMILSPRNLAKGYPWAETAVHEFIHFLIRRISPDHIPIWLHEGTAQIYQGYPYEKGFKMEPSQWGLFKKRREKKKLLDLKTLKEPFPYRETPEETELAYVQALLFTNWLDKKCGAVKLIEMSGRFGSVDKGLEKCVGLPAAQIEAKFLTEIMPSIQVPDRTDVAFFARDFSSSDPLESEGKETDVKSRNLAQLSSEMFKQGRFRGAAMEMQKALIGAPVAPPSWRNQLAQSLIKSGKASEARIVLKRLLEDYPTEASAWYLMGLEEYQKSRFEKAWAFFLRSYFVNPFLDGLIEKMSVIEEKNPQLAKDYVLRDVDL